MKLFKPTYTYKGKGKTCRTWYVGFEDHTKTRRKVAGYRDKDTTADLGKRIDNLVRLRVIGERPDADMSRWLDELPDSVRRRCR